MIHVDSDSRELASEYVHIDFRKILQFSSQQMNFVFSQKFYKNLGKATITKEVTKKLHSRNIFWWKHSVDISGLLCHSVFVWKQLSSSKNAVFAISGARNLVNFQNSTSKKNHKNQNSDPLHTILEWHILHF